MPRTTLSTATAGPQPMQHPPVTLTEQQIDALLRRHERDDRRLQWLVRAMIVLTMGLVALAWFAPLVG
jgi:hypothetical protein